MPDFDTQQRVQPPCLTSSTMVQKFTSKFPYVEFAASRCEQMLPSNKDYYITLHRMKESFLLTCQDAAVHQNLIFQITNCEIHVPIVELTPEKRQEERDKINSSEGIAYKILNDYVRSFYIYPIDRIKNAQCYRWLQAGCNHHILARL